MRPANRGLDPAERTTMSARTDETTTTTTTGAPTTQPAEQPARAADDAVDAAVYGALGCHERNGLREAYRSGRGTRVLCPSHAADFENGGGRR